MSPAKAVRLTPKVRDLVAPDRLSRPPVGKLTAAQVEVLSAIATGGHALTEPVSARKAVHALAVGAKPDASIPVLKKVLAQLGAPVIDRVTVTAAGELGQVATPAAVAALVQRAGDPHSRVQQAVRGRPRPVGRSRGAAGAGPAGGTGRRHHPPTVRAGQGPHRPPPRAQGTVPPRDQRRPAGSGGPEEMAPVTLRLKTAKATEADLARLRGSTYGITPGDRSLALRCGRSEWTIFVNAGLGTSLAAPDRVFERPSIVAVVGRWYPPRIATTTQYVVLQPTDQRRCPPRGGPGGR